MKLSGAWMTKLEAALRRVLRGHRVAPHEKWLVFSAFAPALVGSSCAGNVPLAI